MRYDSNDPRKRGEDKGEEEKEKEEEKPLMDVGVDTDGSGLSIAIRVPGVPNVGIDTKDGSLTILPF